MEEEITHVTDEGNVSQLTDQLLVDSADNEALEAGLMFSETNRLLDDDTAKQAIEASGRDDNSTMDKRDAHTIALENAITAYKQRRDRFRQFLNPIDLVLNLGQIVLAIMILIHLKGEEDQTLFIWIIVYTCGCILHLPIICYQLCRVDLSLVYYKLQKLFEHLFVAWSLLLLWYFIARSSSMNDTTQHIWLSLAFFAFIFIRDMIPNKEWINAWLPLFVIELVCYYIAQMSITLLVLLGLVYLIIVVIVWWYCFRK